MVGWGEVQSGGIEMTVEAAIESVKKEYYKACACEWVKDPLCFALYTTWKKADDERRKKELIGKRRDTE